MSDLFDVGGKTALVTGGWMMAFALADPDSRRAIEESVPLGRIGRPDDVAGLTLFLASRAGAYMTDTVIPLDGGITGCG